MRRKPAIILVLLLFLSIGGAVFYQQMRKDTSPGFAEVDAFLRLPPVSGDWRFDGHVAVGGYHHSKPGWWNRLGIRRLILHQQENYRFTHVRTNEMIIFSVWREGNSITKVGVSGSSSNIETFKDFAFSAFPQLRRIGVLRRFP
jgi:hypothetical protein